MSKLSPFNGQLGEKNAAHLLRRCTFSPNMSEVKYFSKISASEAFRKLQENQIPLSPPRDWKTGRAWVHPKPGRNNTHNRHLTTQVKSWWMQNILKKSSSLTDKMAFFWHTVFVSRQEKVDDATALYYQLKLFYQFALGNVKVLARQICTDNAMLIFLDNIYNTKAHINENLAREFLELFTIGKGPMKGSGNYTTYTESDIRELARILTGITVDPDYRTDNESGIATGKIKVDDLGRAFEHDPGVKQFSSAFQNQKIYPRKKIDGLANRSSVVQEVNEMIDMIFRQKETAVNICKKLYRYFINSQQTESSVINEMAEVLYQNNYEILPVLEKLFTSDFFFDRGVNPKKQIVGGKIKSPLELTAGTIRMFNLKIPAGKPDLFTFYDSTFEYGILEIMRFQGMDLYEPDSTAGYQAYYQEPAYDKNWISTESLIKRYQLGERLIRGRSFSGRDLNFKLNAAKFIKQNHNFGDPSDPQKLVEDLLQFMFPVEVDQPRIHYFEELLLDGLEKYSWKMEWKNYIREGENPGLERQLNHLVKSIIESPEYQLN